MNGELPSGWKEVRLGDIVSLNPRHPASLDDSLSVTFTPMPALSENSHRFKRSEERPLRQVKKGYTHFADGDVLLAKITPCMENGKAAVATGLANGIGCGTTELHVLRPKEGVNSWYLYHYLHQKSFRREATANFTGTAGQLRVPVAFMAGAEIPLPPTAEQARIVAKLEKLLEKVDDCRERLEKIPAILKRFRQSVLAAACSGRLTADWRKDHPYVDNASSLVRGIAEARQKEGKRASRNFGRKHGVQTLLNGEAGPVEGIGSANPPKNWYIASIEETADCIDHLRVPVTKSSRIDRGGTIPYYGANGQVGWIDDYLFDEELVLVVEDETFIGRERPFSYVIRGKSWVNNHAHVLRPLGGITADYLNISLSYYNFTPLTSGTTGRRKLNQASLVKAAYWLAPLDEQHEIVRRR